MRSSAFLLAKTHTFLTETVYSCLSAYIRILSLTIYLFVSNLYVRMFFLSLLIRAFRIYVHSNMLYNKIEGVHDLYYIYIYVHMYIGSICILSLFYMMAIATAHHHVERYFML